MEKEEPTTGSSKADNSAGKVPERLDIYEIKRELGRGGMGVVYLARRQDGFDMDVAVKVLKRGMDTDEVVERFRRERQILADLKHPGIASILDGGATPDGRPYLVMEYVDGLPLTRYMDDHGMSLSNRLRLFVEVCEAVSFAHQNLVIHRDLKPANILVNRQGSPKLLDFGIASIISPESGEAMTHMNTDYLPFTPDYAAPEQIMGKRLSAACDVYALGVMLFHLLTGRHPFKKGSSEALLARYGMRRDVIKPSAALERKELPFALKSETGTIPRDIARARGTELERLKRRLDGDLDSIALTALANDPNDRYASVEKLARDITRYLEGKPISARKATRFYLLRKFFWRNRYKLSVLAAFLFVVMGFVGALKYQLKVAEREQQRAERVTDFLTGLFKNFDPIEGKSATINAEDFLGMGTRGLEQQFTDDPLLRARIEATIGQTYVSVGKYEKALELLSDAQSIRENLLGENHLLTAEIYHQMGRAYILMDHMPEATRYLEKALAIRMDQLGPRSREVITTRAALANMYIENAQAADAMPILEQILESNLDGRIDEEWLTTMTLLAESSNDLGNTKKALDVADFTLKHCREFYGNDHPAVAQLLSLRGHLLSEHGRYEEGIKDAEEAVAIYTARFGRLHANVANALNDLAYIKRSQGLLEETELIVLDVYDINARVFGEWHMNTAITINNLAMVSINLGKYDEARELLEKALAIYRGRDPQPLRYIGVNKINQGRVYYHQRDFTTASRLLEDAAAYLARVLENSHVRFGLIELLRARMSLATLQNTLAETQAEKAFQIFAESYGHEHYNTAEAAMVLAEIQINLDCINRARILIGTYGDKVQEKNRDQTEILRARLAAR